MIQFALFLSLSLSTCASVFFRNIYSIISGGKKEKLISRHQFHTRNKASTTTKSLLAFNFLTDLFFSSVVFFGSEWGGGGLNSSLFTCFYRSSKMLNVDEEKNLFEQVIGLQLIRQWTTFVPFPTHNRTNERTNRREYNRTYSIADNRIHRRRKKNLV